MFVGFDPSASADSPVFVEMLTSLALLNWKENQANSFKWETPAGAVNSGSGGTLEKEIELTALLSSWSC